MQSPSWETLGWKNHKLESRLLGEICRWHHPCGRKWRETKKPLDESERGEWKFGLNLNIQKTKIMASCPITLWQIDEETVETVRLYFWGAPKSLQMVIASMKLKDVYSLEGVMTNLDSILKSIDITLSTKVHLVKLWFSRWSCMDVRVGLWIKLSIKELMLLNCDIGEDSWESLGQQGDPTSPS